MTGRPPSCSKSASLTPHRSSSATTDSEPSSLSPMRQLSPHPHAVGRGAAGTSLETLQPAFRLISGTDPEYSQATEMRGGLLCIDRRKKWNDKLKNRTFHESRCCLMVDVPTERRILLGVWPHTTKQRRREMHKSLLGIG